MIQRTLFLIPMVLCTFGPALAEDWPQWRGPDRTGISKEKGLLKAWPPSGPKLLWTFRDAGDGYSCISVMGDRLYSMGGNADDDKEYVYAIDLKTQKKLWSVEVGDFFKSAWPGPRSTPTIDGNFLYTIGGYGDLICVDTNTGKKVWSQAMKTSLDGDSQKYGYCESPLVDGDVVLATPGGIKGALAAFDKKTGILKWRSKECPLSTAYSSVVAIELNGIRQYIQIPGAETAIGARAAETLVGVRASDGKLLWEFPCPKTVSTPIYHDGCVYVSSMSRCWAIKLVPDGNKFKTEEIYTNTVLKNHIGGLVLAGEYVYGYCYSGGGLKCQNFKTGKSVWTKKSGGSSGSLIYADGNLYCCNGNGGVLLIKATPAGYREVGQFTLPERSQLSAEPHTYTSPVVANGKLYLRDHELIFCYDIHKPQ